MIFHRKRGVLPPQARYNMRSIMYRASIHADRGLFFTTKDELS